MFHFLETDIREQRKYEIRTQTSVDNAVSNRYEIKFENCVKHKTLLFFLEQKYVLFSETYYFKIPKNLITSAFFCRGRY